MRPTREISPIGGFATLVVNGLATSVAGGTVDYSPSYESPFTAVMPLGSIHGAGSAYGIVQHSAYVQLC